MDLHSIIHDFDKFANPSKEERIATYLPMFTSNAISVERFVEEIYGDDLTEEEKKQEIERLNALKVQDTLTSDSFDKNDGNVDSADNTADNL